MKTQGTRGFYSAGRGKGSQTPTPRPAPPGSHTKSLTDADHFSMIDTAQRRFAPTVIDILRNCDRHQFGMSDRLRRNPHDSAIAMKDQYFTDRRDLFKWDFLEDLLDGCPQLS
jgi:hypothetical protein